MKTKISLIVALSLLAVIISACSFTTANISSFNLGKNDTATPPTTTFDVGEKVYAVTVVSNAMGKHKVKFKVTFENVHVFKKHRQRKELHFLRYFQGDTLASS